MLVCQQSGDSLKKNPKTKVFGDLRQGGGFRMVSTPGGLPQFASQPIAPVPSFEQTGTHKKASVLPLMLAVITLLVSIGIQAFQYQLANNIWYYVGYLLTPLLITMLLGWDSIAQRSGRKDPWFETKPIYSKVLRFLVLAGFVVAVFHIVAIGIQIGEQVVQSGVIL